MSTTGEKEHDRGDEENNGVLGTDDTNKGNEPQVNNVNPAITAFQGVLNVSKSLSATPTSGQKRKATESPPSNEEIAREEANIKLIEAVQKVSQNITALCNKIKQKSNTRKDIKDDSECLQDLNRTLLEGLVLKKFRVLNVNMNQGDNQTEIVKKELKRRRYFCERCTTELDRDELERKDIRSKLKESLDYEENEYEEFVRKPWPEATFEKTKEIEGNPLSAKEGDTVLFVNEKGEDTTLMGILKNRYPETEDMLNDETEKEERLQYLECTVSTKKKTSKRRLHIVETRKEKDLRKILLCLKNGNLTQDVKKLTIAVSLPELKDIIRKSIEIIFYEEADWKILCPQKE